MWMDWERSYFTMTDPNISYIWGFLKLCHERGWLYTGHRPMVWCLRCGTSLSQHEVTATDSYRDLDDPSLYVRFRSPTPRTRRSWCGRRRPGRCRRTSPRRVKPDAEYVWVEPSGGRPRRSPKERCEAVFGAGARVVGSVRGAELVGRPYATGVRRPAPRRRGSRTASSPRPTIVLDEGTGIVHIAPGCGAEDFELGRREGLPVLVPVDEAGPSSRAYGGLVGHGAHEAPDIVVEHLERGGWLLRARSLRTATRPAGAAAPS